MPVAVRFPPDRFIRGELARRCFRRSRANRTDRYARHPRCLQSAPDDRAQAIGPILARHYKKARTPSAAGSPNRRIRCKERPGGQAATARGGRAVPLRGRCYPTLTRPMRAGLPTALGPARTQLRKRDTARFHSRSSGKGKTTLGSASRDVVRRARPPQARHLKRRATAPNVGSQPLRSNSHHKAAA